MRRLLHKLPAHMRWVKLACSTHLVRRYPVVPFMSTRFHSLPRRELLLKVIWQVLSMLVLSWMPVTCAFLLSVGGWGISGSSRSWLKFILCLGNFTAYSNKTAFVQQIRGCFLDVVTVGNVWRKGTVESELVRAIFWLPREQTKPVVRKHATARFHYTAVRLLLDLQILYSPLNWLHSHIQYRIPVVYAISRRTFVY